MRILIALAIALALPTALAAQESASFLKIGVGARALGMGGAFTAIADDAAAIAWNPAGLAGLRQREIGFMHAEMVENTHFDYFGLAQPARGGTFGVGVRHLSQGTIQGRDSSGRPTDGYSASDTAVDLSYGFKSSERLRLGGGVKIIHSTIAEASAQSLALDLGSVYECSYFGPGVPRLGLAVQNIGPGMKFLDERSPLPLTVASGVGYRLPSGLTVAVDYRHRPYSRASELNLGTEYAVLGSFAVRAGYASMVGGAGSSALKGFAGGFGLTARGYSLDYSITPFGELGNAHRLSIGARF